MDYSARETIFVPGVYIRINEDTLRVCLSNHLKRLEKKSRWTTPYAIFATIVIVLVTSDFHDFIVSGDTWQKIFYIASILSALWFIRSVLNARKSETVDDIINDLIEKAQK